MAAAGDDASKMGYLLMVSQFFGIDEAWTTIPRWLLSLNVSGKQLDRLRGDDQKKNREENEMENKEKKRKKKKKTKVEDREYGEDIEEETYNDNQ
ncbi:hypothetical protein QYF36_026061 [Acer negundo]|nr:hypothetical protein QYF36_026061 [Acer negundo]